QAGSRLTWERRVLNGRTDREGSQPSREYRHRSGPVVGRDRRASRKNPPRLWTAAGGSRICRQRARRGPIRRPMATASLSGPPGPATSPRRPRFLRDGSRAMKTSTGERNPVELLAEEFLDRKRRGERPTLQEYLDRRPELAAEIRDLFPALLMME